MSPRSAGKAFRNEAASVAAARGFLTRQLLDWDCEAVLWTAQVALSELATNCILHAGTGFTVDVRLLADGAVRLEVGDGSPRAPRQRHYDLEATTGRGVGLVEALARTWGVQAQPAGKVVWCELAPDPVEAAGAEQLELGELPPLDLDAFLSEAELDPAPRAGTSYRSELGGYGRSRSRCRRRSRPAVA